MRCRDATDDVAQDVYLRVVAAEQQTSISNAKAYLFEVARNAAKTERRKRSRRILDAIEDATTQNPPQVEPSAEHLSIARERLALFCDAVMTLPPQCRTVFVMCKVHCLSYREISAALAISESTVEKHVGTGLARCAAYVHQHETGEIGAVPLKTFRGRGRA